MSTKAESSKENVLKIAKEQGQDKQHRNLAAGLALLERHG